MNKMTTRQIALWHLTNNIERSVAITNLQLGNKRAVEAELMLKDDSIKNGQLKSV